MRGATASLAALALLVASGCARRSEIKPVVFDAPTAEPQPDGVSEPAWRLLSEPERRLFARKQAQLPSPCRAGVALARQREESCALAEPAKLYLLRLVREGYTGDEITERYQARYLCKPQPIKTDGAPERAGPGARVTVAVFSDFECERCREARGPLEQLARDPRVRLVFLHFPLPQHRNAAAAAAAAAAAQRQGRFWAFHDRLFAEPPRLAPAQLLEHAAALRLNVNQFQRDLEVGLQVVALDLAQGQRLGIKGTPTVFVNGCRYVGPNLKDLPGWVDDAALRLGALPH